MVIQLLSSSDNTYENQSEIMDDYCTDLFLGPLVWAIFSVPSACVGVPASVWLLWVLIQRQHSGLSKDIYMLNITVMDLILMLYIGPITVNYLFLRNSFISLFRKIIYSFNSSGRPLLMAFICVDCYMAVVFPIAYRKMKNSKHRIVACALTWGLTLLYGVVFTLGVRNLIFTTTYILISYVFTLLTIIFCDLSILYTLRKPDPSGKTDVHPQKQRAIQTITNSFIMIVMSYLPPIFMYYVVSVTPLTEQEEFCNLLLPSFTFSRLGSAILPLLHLGNLGSAILPLLHLGNLGSAILPLLHLGNLGSFRNLKDFQCCKF